MTNGVQNLEQWFEIDWSYLIMTYEISLLSER